ncbi:hypothetical protein KCP69_01785 [Salmonella enterica subsp. enterica]|nr:hypothetical protein KCP69_01785 [Salmonella enterica subsp. enterica]
MHPECSTTFTGAGRDGWRSSLTASLLRVKKALGEFDAVQYALSRCISVQRYVVWRMARYVRLPITA